MWDIIKKIAGKFHTHTFLKITNKKDVADELAITFSKNSSAKNGNEKFAKFKQKAEKLKLNFKSNNTESYKLPFTIELKDAIQTSHNTAIGPNEIHYEFLKHLPKKSLDYLLTIFNDIWMNGTFPESWKIATIIPIPKPGKDNTNPSIAPTSCHCKTMECIVNRRLVWYLKSNKLITNTQCGF